LAGELRSRIDALIDEEDRSAEFGAGLVRIAAGLMLGAIAAATAVAVPDTAQEAFNPYQLGTLIVGGFVLSGMVAAALARSRLYRRGLPYAFLALDAILIGLLLHLNFRNTGLPGDFAASFPVAWLAPLLLTVSALRIRPGVQLFGLITFAAAILVAVIAHGTGDPESRRLVAGEVGHFFAPRPNSMRFAMFGLAGALLVVAAFRGRALLMRALAEAENRAALTRFLPAEITPLLTDARADALRRGRRQPAAILFLDIRDSTARAEHMDPELLSVFIASFRRRVMRASEQHGGVVDKFIGDGALVVFGLPEPRSDDAARSLACARTLLGLVERWNRKRRFEPPVQVGIGVHFGEVYFGVVGDDRRMELTVMGDTVNVAARLEQATKTAGTPLLASAEVVDAAAERAGWEEMPHEPIRGRSGRVRMLRPAPGGPTDCSGRGRTQGDVTDPAGAPNR
jgi:adenylate cyclase